MLKLGHHLAEKPLSNGTIGPIVLERVLSSQVVIITDCSSSEAMATADSLRRLVNSICAGNAHLILVILCEKLVLPDTALDAILVSTARIFEQTHVLE